MSLRTLAALASPLLLAACQVLPSTGKPFEPVAAEAGAAAPGLPDARFPPEELATIPSEQLTPDPAPAAAPAPSAAPADAAPTPAAAAPADGQAAAPAAGAPPAAIAPPAAAPAAEPVFPAIPSQWPLRLVRALADTQPPRAILGLPDGAEVVVTPGAMLPEHGIVVMSILYDKVQLAKVSAEGDHAVIEEATLISQY